MPENIAHLPSGIDLCYETFGDPDRPTILLVMGLGGPMGWWSVELCTALADRGFHVVRYDNRDTGRSTKVRGVRVTRRKVVTAFLGSRRGAPYSIGDLAADAFGLLDHLRVQRAHVVGVSMGGMIVQAMAIEDPARVLSLTSIMSTTGQRGVGWQHPRLAPVMLSSAGPSREEYVARSLRVAAAIGSPVYPADHAESLLRAGETYDRGWSAGGVLRQMMAVLTQPDRTSDLGRLDLPVCVIHGLEDRLVHPSGGRATARAIPRAELVMVPGMAHDLPPALYPVFVEAISRTTARADVNA